MAGNSGNHVHRMGSVEKNLGFVFDSRLLDALLTGTCIALAGLGLIANHDVMTGFAVPAAIGVFRQFVPLLTFPFVVSILLLAAWLAASAAGWT